MKHQCSHATIRLQNKIQSGQSTKDSNKNETVHFGTAQEVTQSPATNQISNKHYSACSHFDLYNYSFDFLFTLGTVYISFWNTHQP